MILMNEPFKISNPKEMSSRAAIQINVLIGDNLFILLPTTTY